MSLLKNLNHQIYWSDIPVIFTSRQFYLSSLSVLFMVKNISTTQKVQLKFATMKSTGILAVKTISKSGG